MQQQLKDIQKEIKRKYGETTKIITKLGKTQNETGHPSINNRTINNLTETISRQAK